MAALSVVLEKTRVDGTCAISWNVEYIFPSLGVGWCFSCFLARVSTISTVLLLTLFLCYTFWVRVLCRIYYAANFLDVVSLVLGLRRRRSRGGGGGGSSDPRMVGFVFHWFHPPLVKGMRFVLKLNVPWGQVTTRWRDSSRQTNKMGGELVQGIKAEALSNRAPSTRTRCVCSSGALIH